MTISDLDDLRPDPANARRHNLRNTSTITDSIRAVGPARSGVIDEDGTILAGNGTAEAMRAAGITRVRIIDSAPDEWVVVRKAGLTPAQKRALAIADNRAGELATWDGPTLAQQGIDLAPWFSPEELHALQGPPSDTPPPPPAPDPQLDKSAALQQQWHTEPGQLWTLGAHRLACGDCRDPALVARLLTDTQIDLVWTDPPYGISYADKNKFLNAIDPGNRMQTPMAGDHASEEETAALCRAALTLASDHARPGAAIYVAVPARPLHRRFIDALNASGFTYKHQLVWVKNHFVLGRSDYHYRHEPILYGWKEDGPHYFVDDHTQCTVLEYDKPLCSDTHPTMKPLPLVEHMIRNSSRAGDLVYDPFSGSGTTLIACERLGRRCRAIEISPAYVAVTLQRWADMTGGTLHCE